MRASKALGRRHDSDEGDVSDPELASEDEGGGCGQDPFFQHDADVFNDPFFTAVRPPSPSLTV